MSQSIFELRVMFVPPVLLLDVISSIPPIAENAFSSGVATVAAMVSDSRPGDWHSLLNVG